MAKWFPGDFCHYASDVERVLRAQGFWIDQKYIIYKPMPSHTMTYEQFELVAFLVQEWDYGFHNENKVGR